MLLPARVQTQGMTSLAMDEILRSPRQRFLSVARRWSSFAAAAYFYGKRPLQSGETRDFYLVRYLSGESSATPGDKVQPRDPAHPAIPRVNHIPPATAAYTTYDQHDNPVPLFPDHDQISRVGPGRSRYRKINPVEVSDCGDADTTNEFGVQLLVPILRDRLFPQTRPRKLSNDEREIAERHLKHHDLLGKDTERLKPVSFELPSLLGNSIQEHFWNIGQRQAQPYLKLALELATAKLPPCPLVWLKQEGWTRYDGRTGKAHPVPYPLEEAIVFDTELLASCSAYPVIATAVSSKAWYGWVSPDLVRMDESFSSKSLIPLGPGPAAEGGISGGPRLVVGHHVGFDRARVKEEYNLNAPRRGYLDTLSLHVACAGLANRQRNVWMKYTKDESSVAEVDKLFCKEGALNSLAHLVRFYLHKEIDKTTRGLFVKGNLRDVRDDFPNLMKYCAQDTELAHGVLFSVLTKFQKKCPHPATFAGIIHMGQSIITVDETWEEYIRRCDDEYHATLESEASELAVLGKEAAILREEEWKSDPWLRNLDWTPVNLGRGDKDKVPFWYKQLYDKKNDKLRVTRRSRATPYLMRLRWLGYPIYYSRVHGWCFRVGKDDPQDELPAGSALVNFSSAAEIEDSDENTDSAGTAEKANVAATSLASKAEFDATARADVKETGSKYYKIPHKDGGDANCGSPLAQGYADALEKGQLTSDLHLVKEVIQGGVLCSYWMSNRDRIIEQFVVYEDEICETSQTDDSHPDAYPAPGMESSSDELKKLDGPVRTKRRQGYILPQLITMATITRRAVERTWLTASNPRKDRIGSELKSMVRAPPGYKIVGADVDSQELWICAVLGDAQFGAHGSTALGWMTVQGSKAAGTDMHSVTAKVLGIDRDKAKQFNYARIYGAGVDFTCTKLQQYSPDLNKEEALKKANELFRKTKGERIKNRSLSLLYNGMYCGGSESFSFNSIEYIAMRCPRTPTLNCEITDTLRPATTKKFVTSKANWAVQSSGVDYLHMLLVAMEYLTKRHGIRARYMISLHDELRYLVADEDVERAALALQIANVWTRAMFAARLGMDNLPQSAAFFSCVDIDVVLRKEVTTTCVTPTQKEAIAPGEARDIFATLERTGGGNLGPVVDQTYDGLAPSEGIVEELAGTSRSLIPSTKSLLKIQVCRSAEEVMEVASYRAPRTAEGNWAAGVAGCRTRSGR